MNHDNDRPSLSYLASGVDPHVLQAVVGIATDLSAHGREGKRVGALFVIGDTKEVVRRSQPLILDPLKGHPDQQKNICNPEMHGTVRELALLDGAFIISADGVVVSAACCLEVTAEDVTVPMGLGSRHRAAASVTKATDALAVVVSQSSAVRLFHDGRIVDELVADVRPAGAPRGPNARQLAAAADESPPPPPSAPGKPAHMPPVMRRRPGAPGGAPRLPAKVPPRIPTQQRVLAWQ